MVTVFWPNDWIPTRALGLLGLPAAAEVAGVAGELPVVPAVF